MNNILKKYHIVISSVLGVEILTIFSIFLLYIFNDDFSQDVSLSYHLIALSAFFVSFDFIISFIFGVEVRRTKNKTELTSAEIIGSDVNEAYNFGQIGLAVCDNTGVVTWLNDFLNLRFLDLIDRKITDVFPEISKLYLEGDEKKDVVRITYENKVYNVQLLHDVKLLAFKDITDYVNETIINHNSSPVVGYISIDNYFDVQISTSDDAKFSDMLSKTRALINDFAHNSFSLIKLIKDDKYIFITTMEHYYSLYEEKFSIVDKIRNLFPNGFTISIGVSYGVPDYSKLADEASSALDIALSRGGDQTVVAPFAQSMIFLGGKTELKPARNRVKIRTLSNSFLSIIKGFENVVIMGHTNSDFDSFGSCYGVYLMCKYAGIDARICYEEQLVEEKCRIAVKTNFSPIDMRDTFIKYKDIETYVNRNTLLVICDHNNPQISMFPGLDTYIKNVAIIDHHRVGIKTYVNPVFNGIDTSSSSTCEILTNYIHYNLSNIPIDERAATFLLAGIALDTSFFKEKSSNSTFEAAAILKQNNADGGKVEEFLKENFEEYKQKIAILNNSDTPHVETLVSISKDSDIISDIMISMVATEALKIKGISLAFCIGRTKPNEVKISARSDGSKNCQIIMERLGGGGHFQMAAGVFIGITVDEAKERLYKVLEEYFQEENDVR